MDSRTRAEPPTAEAICETVRLEVDGPLATVTLDRPPLNILDLETIAGLAAAADRLAQRDSLQLVLLRGATERAFSAGVAIEIHTPELIPTMIHGFHDALRRWWRLPMLTVAVVQGHCLGGGMELAAVCDLVVADGAARFGQPEIFVGCFPPVAAALYPSLLGPGRSLDLMVSGRQLSAREAEHWGFVTRLAEPGAVDETVAQLVSEVTRQSAIAQRLGKKAVRASLGNTFEDALEKAERIYLEEMAKTADVAEGAQAFLEKRQPVWRHR